MRWEAAARGIMTTDTFPKAATRTAQIGDAPVRITRHCQGQRHDRARHGDDAVLRVHRREAAGRRDADACCGAAWMPASTAPRWTSDTSTSDTVLLFATGQAKHPRIPSADGPQCAQPRAGGFRRASSTTLLLDLALQVMRDGEGAQKLVRIDVTGAATARSAKRIAMAVANSPLVKTAIAGEDANWGRIVMAVGKAGEPADRDKLSIGGRRRMDGARRRRGAGLRRGAGGGAHEGPRGRDRDRYRAGAGARRLCGPAI